MTALKAEVLELRNRLDQTDAVVSSSSKQPNTDNSSSNQRKRVRTSVISTAQPKRYNVSIDISIPRDDDSDHF